MKLKNTKVATLAATLITIGSLAGGANGAIQVFTDRAAWRIAAGGGLGDLVENFDSFSGTTVYGNTTGISAGGFSFSVFSGDFGADTSWSIRDAAVLAGSQTVNGSPYVSLVSVAAPSGDTLISHTTISAFGFDYRGPSNTPSNDANPLTLTTSLGDDITGPTILGASSGFFGFLYDAGEQFTSIQVRDLADNRTFFGADNFEAYSAASIPEPSSALLLGLGALGLVVRRKRTT